MSSAVHQYKLHESCKRKQLASKLIRTGKEAEFEIQPEKP